MVYLPKGTRWQAYFTANMYDGGSWYNITAPLNQFPFFIRRPLPPASFA
jgi:alpha-glucosidase (family GH31 glycosyl hydrolase)